MIPEIQYVINGCKKSVSLKLDNKQFSLISHLFRNTGMPVDNSLDFGYNGYKWVLYNEKYTAHKNGEYITFYNIYGVCGDSTFGNSPWYYRKQYWGNIKAGRFVYEKFLKKYFLNQEATYEIY